MNTIADKAYRRISMSGEHAPPTTENSNPQVTIGTSTTDSALESLREMLENIGQMSEMAKEEETLVADFFSFLTQILASFTKTLEISASALPQKYREQVGKAYLYLTGQLILVYRNGEAEILNLMEPDNYDILVEIAGEIMLKLKSVIDSYKSKTEKRVNFLLAITKELQKVATVFAEK
jgi:hypothetical protein